MFLFLNIDSPPDLQKKNGFLQLHYYPLAPFAYLSKATHSNWFSVWVPGLPRHTSTEAISSYSHLAQVVKQNV
jgi:hypothetical protein